MKQEQSEKKRKGCVSTQHYNKHHHHITPLTPHILPSPLYDLRPAHDTTLPPPLPSPDPLCLRMADLSRSESGDDAYDDLGGGGSGGSEYTEESYTGDEDGSDRGSRGSRGSRSEGSEDGSEEGSEEDEEEPILKYRRLRGDVTKILGGEALPAGDAASCMTVHPDFIVSCLDHDPTDPTPTPHHTILGP